MCSPLCVGGRLFRCRHADAVSHGTGDLAGNHEIEGSTPVGELVERLGRRVDIGHTVELGGRGSLFAARSSQKRGIGDTERLLSGPIRTKRGVITRSYDAKTRNDDTDVRRTV